MKFRKKPVVIEAHHFNSGWSPSKEFAAAVCRESHFGMMEPARPHIHTLEGPHYITVGDWIIKGVQGEFYPCKPDIFAATYEPAWEDNKPESLVTTPPSEEKS